MLQKGKFRVFGRLVVLLLLATTAGYGQPADELVDIVSDDGTVSFTVPSNFLVHREAERIRIFSGSSEAEITITIEEKKSARKYVKAFGHSAKGVTGEDEKEFSIRRYEFIKAGNYRMMIYYGAADTFFSISGSSDNKLNPAITQFFSSMRLPLVPPAAGAATSTPTKLNRQLKYSQLTTSHAVNESLGVPHAPQRIVSYGKVQADEKPFDKAFSRRLIVVARPRARYTDQARQAGKEGTIPAEIQFLADGTIGYIKVDPSVDRSLAENVVLAARQVKFVPAQINGRSVDAVRVIVYSFEIY